MRIGFGTLLIAVVVVSLAIGGSFAGGMTLGRSQAPEATPSGFARPFSTGTPRAGTGGDQFGGFMGITGQTLGTGTIEKIEGDRITVATSNGTQTFTLANEVTIQKLGAVSLGELKPGDRVTLMAAQGSPDKVNSIMVVPSTSPRTPTAP